MAAFELNLLGITRVLSEAPAVAELERRASLTVGTARATGPRSTRHRHEIDKVNLGATHVTSAGAVVDVDWASHVWHLIEFGSANNPPYRPITRAAQQAGLRVVDGRRSV